MGGRGASSHIGQRIPVSALGSLQNFDAKNLADLQRTKNQSGLSDAEIYFIEGQLKRLIAENDFAMAVKSYLIEPILNSHFKNQMETGTSQGANAPDMRARLSADYFGHGVTDPNKNPDFFEKYGYLAPRDKAAADRNKPWYGDALVRFKRENAIDRTTFKTADTLNTWREPNGAQASRANNPSITGISSIEHDTYARVKNAAHLIRDPSDWVDAVNVGEYFELQYHGHLTMDDVASITFHEGVPSWNVISRLKQKGIKVYKLNGGTVNEL